MNDETIDDLQLDGLMLIQKKNNFKFGVDAVLLSNFAKVKKGDKILDIGTGTGIIPVLMVAKTQENHITGLEIQKDMADMAFRSIQMNKMCDRVSIVQGDIKDWDKLFGKAKFDLIVCNPPYMQSNAGIHNVNDAKAIARHEVKCTLEDVVRASAGLLKPYGRLAIIHRPARLVDIMVVFRDNFIEPKTLRFIHSNPTSMPSMVLIQGTKQGKKELKILQNLYIFDQDGNYSKEINQIYGRLPERE